MKQRIEGEGEGNIMNLKEATLFLMDVWKINQERKNKGVSIAEIEDFYIETDVLEDFEEKKNDRARDNDG